MPNATITIRALVREPGAGYPQAEDYSGVAFTRLPASVRSAPVVVPVIGRRVGDYWCDPASGRSGYLVDYTATVPAGFLPGAVEAELV